jgi:hypothetical protein
VILIEAEPALPAAVESIKAKTLITLGAMHPRQEYDTVAALSKFLDDLLNELRGIQGAPPGLTRVLLFYRDKRAVQEVAARLMPGGTFLAFQMPGCWVKVFKPKLPHLLEWARSIEPGYVADAMKGIGD